ncbi:hypothetical protein [Streptomyces sp. YIM 98790]|uniref:hypothetical protein n=1 Tax=Streptomyces sp. YIM 98790 TaxID=2689077 RepID=UPI00140D1F74|nr:hypothetical protein [Streptomyces sp. YIM 98790]
MPHPTPQQIAYGSAAVVSASLLMLLLSPSGSVLTASLIAFAALCCGVVVAIAVHSRRGIRESLVTGARTAEPDTEAPVPAPSARPHTAERPEVRV